MKRSKFFTVLFALAMALVLLTGSIALPILVRPFYYAHIGAMQLREQTGWSESEIRTAYDEMMDYCLGGTEFSTGKLAWSQEGKSHFTDVRRLFLLDLWVLGGSVALLAILLFLRCRPKRILGRGAGFWAGVGLGGSFLLIGGLAALDFDRAFTVFHHLFFPGKSNWLFDPNLDEIILILPQEFFRNCAILILSVLVLGCGILIALDFHHKK